MSFFLQPRARISVYCILIVSFFCLLQRGHGIGSIISRFVLPALRKIAPIIKTQVKKHGKSVAKEVGQAALKSLKAKNSKRALKREIEAAIERRVTPQRKKKKKKVVRRDVFTKPAQRI